MDDTEILDLYWHRDEEAIVQTEKAYGARLHKISKRILDNTEDVKECVNDTYLHAWNRIPPERPNFFYAYLSKICRFISLGRLDWNQAEKRKAEVISLTRELELCIPDDRTQQTLDAFELGELLSDFLKGQTPDNRLIFMRRYWHMESVEEIAAVCGFSQSKVKTQLHRMRSKLYQFLEKEGVRI